MEEKKYWARRGEYLVHRDGTIYKMNWRGTGQMRIVRQCHNRQGYLCFGYKRKTVRSHRFIAELFIPNPENLPQVNHRNEIKDDNRVENLEWCDARYNTTYGSRNERIAKAQINGKKSKRVRQYTLDGTFIREWPSTREIERQLDFKSQNISACCLGKLEHTYGYVWRYAE